MILISFLIFIMVSISLFSESPMDLSIEKQEILFWGIVIIVFQVLVFFLIFIDQHKLSSDLRKIINYKDLYHPQSKKLLSQMGEVGTLINLMLSDFSRLLDLRLSRINALNKTLKTVCEDYPEPIIITDTMGTILGISKVLSKRIEFPKNGFNKIDQLFTDLKIVEVMGIMEKNKEYWKEESGSDLSCTPVFDNNGDLNLCIWEAGANLFQQRFNASQITGLPGKTMKSLKGIWKKKGSPANPLD